MDSFDELLARIDSGELGDPLPVLAYVAGQAVELVEEELNGARRRALLLVAAGGDPHRELGVRDRAVKALAADLYTAEGRAQLGRSIDALVLRVRELRWRARRRSFLRRMSTLRGDSSRSPACGGDRGMTPAVEAAKSAGIAFELHEYEGVEVGDGDYADAVAELSAARRAALQDARRTVDGGLRLRIPADRQLDLRAAASGWSLRRPRRSARRAT